MKNSDDIQGQRSPGSRGILSADGRKNRAESLWKQLGSFVTLNTKTPTPLTGVHSILEDPAIPLTGRSPTETLAAREPGDLIRNVHSNSKKVGEAKYPLVRTDR